MMLFRVLSSLAPAVECIPDKPVFEKKTLPIVPSRLEFSHFSPKHAANTLVDHVDLVVIRNYRPVLSFPVFKS